MSHVTTEPLFGVSEQVWHKPGCATTEDGKMLEISSEELFYLRSGESIDIDQLICVFVFVNAKRRFSHDAFQMTFFRTTTTV